MINTFKLKLQQLDFNPQPCFLFKDVDYSPKAIAKLEAEIYKLNAKSFDTYKLERPKGNLINRDSYGHDGYCWNQRILSDLKIRLILLENLRRSSSDEQREQYLKTYFQVASSKYKDDYNL